ncbi:MAG: extracellular solute-binding protein, partial [Actinobacteria bacterium]|nr:extracellular solute-binding protein [Actinomycetota bacterium]
VVLVSWLIVSCKPAVPVTEETTPAVEETTAATETTAEETKPAEKVTIRWWDWQVMENYMAAMDKIIKMYEEAHPNVTIERKAIPAGEFEKQLKAALAGGEAPDLFGVQHGAQTTAYYEAGILYDWYPDWKADLEWQKQVDLESPIFSDIFIDGKAVIMPTLDLWIHAIYYYKDMLEKYGLEKPETVDDWVKIAPVLAKENIIPMSIAFGPNSIVWTPNCMWAEFMMQYLGGDVITKLETGKLSWKDPIVKEGLLAMKKMQDGGVFPKDVMSAEYFPDVLTRFQNKEAWSFYIAGDWTIGSMNKEDVKNDNIGVMPLPKIAPDAKSGYAQANGVSQGMEPDNPNKEVIKDILKFFSSKEAAAVLIENDIHPISKLASELPIENNLMKEVIKESTNPDYFYSPYVLAMDPEIGTRIVENLGKFFLGTMTADQVVEDLEQFTKEQLSK